MKDIKKITRKLASVLFYLFLSVLLFSCGGCSNENGKVPDENNGTGNNNGNSGTTLIGKVLPDWEEGYLDIHTINTGRGESTFFILPDGTTMLVDAAGSLISPTDDIPPPPAKPNASAVSGQTITNYVAHFVKSASKKLDYVMISHWHGDHMGEYATSLPQHSSGQFRMGGITQVGANIRFDKIIDRGYPDYNYPRNILSSSANMANYVNFINWAKETYGTTAEQFDVGSAEQIILQKDAAKYTNFQIRNIVGNGYVWTGSGTQTRNTFPEDINELVSANPNENIFSLGFHLKYGLFDYFTAGDLQYNGRSTHSWMDIEQPVAEVMGAVEILKANHHATSNCNSDVFLKKLKPKAVIIHTWRDVQPNPTTIQRMFDANSDCQIFTTNMTDANKDRLAQHIAKFKSTGGHIVVRVEPGGDKYSIYVLDDTNENYVVQRVFGPYHSN